VPLLLLPVSEARYSRSERDPLVPISDLEIFSDVGTPIATAFPLTGAASSVSTTTGDLTSGLLLAGPVGEWRFNDGSGTVVVDSSGNGQDGTYTGSGPTWVTGHDVGALSFDGNGDYVTVPDNASFGLAISGTVSVWMAVGQAATTQYVVKKATNGTTDGWEIGLSSTTGKIFWRLNQKTSANTYRIESTTNYATNGATWQHVVGTYDGTTIKIYVNGTMETSAAGPASIATNSLKVSFAGESDGYSAMKGLLDTITIFDYALTQAEVSALYSPSTPTLSLAGDSSSTSACAGSLTIAMALSAVVADVSTTVGAMTATYAPAGAASSTSTTSGVIRKSTPVSGTATSTSSTTGAVTNKAQLGGSSTSGSLTFATTMATVMKMLGAALSTSSGSAAMTVTLVPTGSALSSSSSTGVLVVKIPVYGAASGVSATAGAVTATYAPHGSSVSTSSSSGMLDQATGEQVWALAGASTSSSSSGGAMTATYRPTGTSVSLTATVSVSLSMTWADAGTAQSASATTGELMQTLFMVGTAVSASTTSGEIMRRLSLTGAAVSTSTTIGVLDAGREWPLAGSCTSTSATSALFWGTGVGMVTSWIFHNGNWVPLAVHVFHNEVMTQVTVQIYHDETWIS
jgi:hypothetical protein